MTRSRARVELHCDLSAQVRVLFIGAKPVEILHKKPKEGGVSATLKSGATYTRYEVGLTCSAPPPRRRLTLLTSPTIPRLQGSCIPSSTG